MSERDDATLVTECLRGNSKAFETIVDRYQRPIFNVALRMVRHRDDAEDIAQSVFVKAYESLNSFNPRYKFFSWIYRMTINESINFIKHRRPSADLSAGMASSEKNPEESLSEKNLRETLLDAMMKLEIDYRAIIILKHFEGFSYEEISYILELPEKTVKSRLYTSRQNLREILISEGVEFHD